MTNASTTAVKKKSKKSVSIDESESIKEEKDACNGIEKDSDDEKIVMSTSNVGDMIASGIFCNASENTQEDMLVKTKKKRDINESKDGKEALSASHAVDRAMGGTYSAPSGVSKIMMREKQPELAGNCKRYAFGMCII